MKQQRYARVTDAFRDDIKIVGSKEQNCNGRQNPKIHRVRITHIPEI